MKLTATNRMLIAIALMVLVAAAFVFLAILPQFASVANLELKKQDTESKISLARASLSRRREAKSAAAETQAQLLRLNNQIPDNPELPSLIIELQDAASAAKVNFNRLVPAQPTAAASGAYSKIPVDMSINAEWYQLLEFLRLLQNMNRVVRVVSVSVIRDTTNDISTTSTVPPQTVTATVKIEAYMMKGKPSAVAPAGAAPSTGVTTRQ